MILTENAFLQVHEVVVVEDNHLTREEYAYYLILDGVEIWGYERDPTHEPPVHLHRDSHSAVEEAEPVSFKDAVERAWHELSIQAGIPDQ